MLFINTLDIVSYAYFKGNYNNGKQGMYYDLTVFHTVLYGNYNTRTSISSFL